MIEAGRVAVAGITATKSATQVDPDISIVVSLDDDPGWASRGALKLEGALTAWPGVAVAGRRCLDAGASTGGFTEVLLEARASEVVAVDVGYGQLLWRLRADPRVVVLDRTNVRSLIADDSEAGAARGRGFVVHLAAAGATLAACVRRCRSRPGAHGQAAVRGRSGTRGR